MADTIFKTKLKASSTSHDETGEFFFSFCVVNFNIYIHIYIYIETSLSSKIIKYKKKTLFEDTFGDFNIFFCHYDRFLIIRRNRHRFIKLHFKMSTLKKQLRDMRNTYVYRSIGGKAFYVFFPFYFLISSNLRVRNCLKCIRKLNSIPNCSHSRSLS